MTAVVTDVKYRMSLSLIRDLADAGVDVTAVHGGAGRPYAFSSRGVRRCVTLPDPAGSPDAYLDGLEALCRGPDRPVLLPVGAATLALLASHRTRFDACARLCIASSEALALANDKARLGALARSLGVPTPEEYAPDALEGLRYPLVVKPVCGEKQGLTAEKRYRVAHGPEEAARAVAAFTFDGVPPVVQTFLPGAGYGCSVLCRDGAIVDMICHRRVREYPLNGGPSTCCVTVEPGEMAGYAEKLVKALNFTGPAMIEFKGDADGRLRLLEINPRLWGTFPLTRAAGSSFAYDWYALAAGRAPRQIEPRVGVRMHYLMSDVRRSAAALRQGRIASALSPVGDWLSPRATEGVFEWRDARASLAYLGSYLKRGLR